MPKCNYCSLDFLSYDALDINMTFCLVCGTARASAVKPQSRSAARRSHEAIKTGSERACQIITAYKAQNAALFGAVTSHAPLGTGAHQKHCDVISGPMSGKPPSVYVEVSSFLSGTPSPNDWLQFFGHSLNIPSGCSPLLSHISGRMPAPIQVDHGQPNPHQEVW